MENQVPETNETEEKTDELKIRKAYQYVPSNVLSFDALEQLRRSEEVYEQIHTLMSSYVQIVDNILYSGLSTNPVMDLQNITLDLLRRLRINKSSDNSEDFEFTGDKVRVVKSGGALEWYGIPTNNFIDREADIFTADAHRLYVKKLKEGSASMPYLYIWHIEEPVGISTIVEYDERGFLKAKGYVFPKYETLVKNLCAMTPDMSMSHGNELRVIRFNKDDNHLIEEYESHEFSFLPNKNAANGLTKFALGDK